jgi:hypothetical protein
VLLYVGRYAGGEDCEGEGWPQDVSGVVEVIEWELAGGG